MEKIKTCTYGSLRLCKFAYMDSGATGTGCGYERYCDYQLPRDSRTQISEPTTPNLPDKE